jgi:peptidoglycan hydrolase-like protein with peptidoglycan-binding domain
MKTIGIGATDYSYNFGQINVNENAEKKIANNQGQTISTISEGAIYESANSDTLIDSAEGKVIRKVANSTITNQQYQSKLSALGFYNGPIDGILTSNQSRKAIRNFQRVYGLSQNGNFNSSTENKLNNVYSRYLSVYQSSQLATISNSSNFGLDYTEKANFARTWAFLREGMGLTAVQASGVMGNMYAESRFSSDNAYDGYYPGDHNSSYSYNANDGIAYGLIQWASSSRKQGLQSEANVMGLSVSDINAQFAYFRKEMNGAYSTPWNNIKSYNSVNSVSDEFLNKIEVAGGGTNARRGYSNTIYNQFYSF